jgi:hypothetical protein
MPEQTQKMLHCIENDGITHGNDAVVELHEARNVGLLHYTYAQVVTP